MENPESLLTNLNSILGVLGFWGFGVYPFERRSNASANRHARCVSVSTSSQMDIAKDLRKRVKVRRESKRDFK